MGRLRDKLKAKLSKHSTKIGAFFMMGILVLSALGAVLVYYAPQAKQPTRVGQLNGFDVLVDENGAYYVQIQQGVNWYFRANPLDAQNVTINERAVSLTRILTSGPGAYDFFTNVTADKVVILLDPAAPPIVTVSAAEVSKALGARQWTPEVAFTGEVDKPGAQLLKLADAINLPDKVVFYFSINENETSGITGLGRVIFVRAAKTEDLDLLSTKVSLILLGLA